MAYLGNAPARSFISFERQVFTIVNSQTAYTLDHSVNNENDLRLVINNIVQEPGSGKAYTASGTTLTLSAALTNGTDEMYCVFLGRATATNAPGSGSVGTSQLASDAVTEAKIADDAVESEHLNNNVISGQPALGAEPADTDEFLVSDAGTIKRVDYSYIKAGDNTPAWKIGMSSSQSLSYNTTTKINFDTSIIDTDSGVDTTNKRYTIPSGEAGKYIVHCFYRTGTGTDSASFDIFVYKNGSLLSDAEDMASFTVSQSYNTVQCTGMLDLAAGDYVEMYARQADQNFTASIGYSNEARFWGYKLIGV